MHQMMMERGENPEKLENMKENLFDGTFYDG
jgi:hypothetical protein